MVCCLLGYRYRIGNTGKVRYNAKTGRLWPSDFCFTMCTLSLILVPTALCYYWAIFRAETIEMVFVKVLLACIYTIFLTLSLRNLYKCSFTEPGVIPSLGE